MEFVLTVMFLVDFLMLIVQYLMGQVCLSLHLVIWSRPLFGREQANPGNDLKCFFGLCKKDKATSATK